MVGKLSLDAAKAKKLNLAAEVTGIEIMDRQKVGDEYISTLRFRDPVNQLVKLGSLLITISDQDIADDKAAKTKKAAEAEKAAKSK